MAGAVEKPKPGGAYRVTVQLWKKLEPWETGGVSLFISFTGDYSPDNSNEADNASNEHTPANDISEDNENCIQEVAHNY